MIQVIKATTQKTMAQALNIREEVFVKEQKVPREEEYDNHEETSYHFLALCKENKPCGTARWRFTEQGIKLERFAVLKPYRGNGVGSALVQAVLDDVQKHPESAPQDIIYLHAQIDAVPLYEKFDFTKTGKEFVECDIRHYKMVRSVI